jgi:phosphate transport system permease protein
MTDARASLARRRAAERRFRLACQGAAITALACLAYLLATIAVGGAGGFVRTTIALPIDLTRLPVEPARLKGRGGDLALAGAGLESAVEIAATRAYGRGGPDLLSDAAWLAVRAAVRARPALIRQPFTVHVPASSLVDTTRKHGGPPGAEALVRRLAPRLGTEFNTGFFTTADATDPTRAGIRGALAGSLLTVAVTLLAALPVGVAAAVYLEEYAPRNRWTDLIEVSVNNLAAVPSIIFGLLGLALFIGTIGLPRSAPLVGGLTLALMTLPLIVIATRGAIRGVAPSVREAAMGVGASPTQVVFHHVLPLAAPGILTGALLGTARALGETAPLLLIGMRAFVAAPPGGLTRPATVLPVQIFLWFDNADPGFNEKTSAAMLVLLAVLLAVNGAAVILRARVERTA